MGNGDGGLIRIRGSAIKGLVWHVSWPFAYVEINTAMVRIKAEGSVETAYKAKGDLIEYLPPKITRGASIRVVDASGEAGSIRFLPMDERLFPTLAANGWQVVERAPAPRDLGQEDS